MSNTVPDGWSNPILGKVFSLLRGSVIPNENPNEKFDYYSLPIFDQTGSSATVLGSEIESNKTLITEQAILVSKLNPRKPRVQLVKEAAGLRRCASTEFMAYAPKSSGVSLPFYKYYFLSEYFSGRLQLVATGSTNSHVRVTPGETLRWSIPHPPLPEQQKIAAILSSVDDVIEKTRAQIDKLKDLKIGMMQELLTKGIGHTAFKDSPVGRIPEGWEVVPLEELCSKISVGIASSTTHAYVQSGVPILRNQNILEGCIRPTDMLHISHEFSDENASKKIREGDVLTVRTGYPGVSAVVPKEFDGCQSFTTLISRPRRKELNPDYLALLINSDYGKNFVVGGQAGGAQQNLNATILKTFPVILPPMEEQVAIFNIVNSVSSKVAVIEKKYRALLSSKKALMQDLLTGKVRVNVDNKENAVA